jgi:predicted nucleic acid-binding protein
MKHVKSVMPNWAGALMVVVDAGVVLGLVLPLPFSDQASAAMRAFREANEEIYAPALLEYEVCSVLRRAISGGIIDAAHAEQAIEWIADIRINPITPAASLNARALYWASRLGHSKAYDAQYLALAEQMKCRLVTADHRLVRAARALSVDWVTGLD